MPTTLRPGEVLRSRYRIRRIIGQGGMGSIYLADDLRLEGRLCAVKEVVHDRSLTAELLQEAREQFLREATTLARLDHPNLPKVSDYFSVGGRDYLVMDFVPGKDLRQIMLEAQRKGTFLSERDVLSWANQLADALAYLHGQNPPILHRDIKPSNLKYTPSGILKLVDFGLVKVLVSDEVTVTIVQGKGTAIYTPLEQYGGEAGHTDTRSDIYAFGATLYHLLTNTPPVEAHERFLRPDSLIPPRQINPDISVRTERAILWAMSLHPEDRPPDVETFRRALLGDEQVTISQKVRLPPPTLLDLISSPLEVALVLLTIGVILLSLILTLAR
ncbi:MAG: serine/threonine protein kinase [Anaerolineales bacterium]|nr:serine/threonine protein kinase [Anaerolineales bacterium]MDW8161791.1 serine/threonine-protein kinase [Anaerolineales bacterium]